MLNIDGFLPNFFSFMHFVFILKFFFCMIKFNLNQTLAFSKINFLLIVKFLKFHFIFRLFAFDFNIFFQELFFLLNCEVSFEVGFFKLLNYH